MANVYEGKSLWLEKPLGWVERLIYNACGINPKQDMDWRGFALAILATGLMGFLFLFIIFSGQEYLPLNPQKFGGLAPDAAFNAAISFITNTNWQSYSGESALSYFSQMMGCTVQNFISAATGMAVAAALCRSLARKQTMALGNAYADIIRGSLYILLPLALILAILLASQGVVQTFDKYAAYTPIDASVKQTAENVIALGPVASQASIKMLGTNGGGFFNANGAHPLENPTPFSNIAQIISLLLIPIAFTHTFGIMAGDRRQGWMLLAAMLIVIVPLLTTAMANEYHANPRFNKSVIDSSAGNMEGKEVRFGVSGSTLWAVAATATSGGPSNSSFDSFMPMGGLVLMLLIQFGEVIFGGVGSGIYGMLMFVFLTVFIGGLMVGRTPEYLGKKLGSFEIKMASIVILIPAAIILLGTAIAVCTDAGKAGLFNPGAQGFSEILYAFSSAGNNNGSAFGGLNAATPFYNVALGIVMLIGRYWIMVPVLAIAGSLASKNIVPSSAGTMPTHTPLFTLMLVGVIVLIGVLTFVPVLALGPIAEHMHLMMKVAP